MATRKKPPESSEVMAQLGRLVGRNGGGLAVALAVVAVAIWAIAGTFSVGPGEVAVVRTFGKVSGQAGPGLHFIFPGVQQRDIVNLEKIQRVEVGFRDKEVKPEEARMLTGDENIIDAKMSVQYRIKDPVKYLFRLADPESALRQTAEVALRSIVGRMKIDDLLTSGRQQAEDEVVALLQRLMDEYDSGITIVQVKLQSTDAPQEVREAFADVLRAISERKKAVEQARGYREEQLPRASGKAAEMLASAEAYKADRVRRARGDAARFLSLLAEYEKAPEVTRRRLHLELVEEVLGRTPHKAIIDERLVASGALPVLPLGGFGQAPAPAPPAAPAAPKGGK